MSVHTASAAPQVNRHVMLSAAVTRMLRVAAVIFSGLIFSLPAWSVVSIHVIGQSTSAVVDADRALLANIFMRRIRVSEQGNALVPVNLPVDHPLRKVFSAILFEQAPEAMERYWNEQYFKGISPPFVVSSMEAVKRFVVSTPGAVGYVLDCQDDGRAEVILKLPLSTEQSRQLSGFCTER